MKKQVKKYAKNYVKSYIKSYIAFAIVSIVLGTLAANRTAIEQAAKKLPAAVATWMTKTTTR